MTTIKLINDYERKVRLEDENLNDLAPKIAESRKIGKVDYELLEERKLSNAKRQIYIQIIEDLKFIENV